MYPEQRREQMVVLLAKHGFIPIADLANMLGVSEMTVRRDLRSLQESGQVQQVTGGGKVASVASEPAFMTKRVLQQAEKHAIAKAALQYIEPGMTIGLSAGTTTWTLAGLIQGFEHLTFVTNSTNIATDLSSNGWTDIILTGGNFRTPSDALVGPLAEHAVRRLHTDILFLGVHGMDPMHGISTPNLLEAAIDRAMMEHTSRVVVLFDHTKWDIAALAHIADVEEIDVAITDSFGGDRQQVLLREAGVDVVVVS